MGLLMSRAFRLFLQADALRDSIMSVSGRCTLLLDRPSILQKRPACLEVMHSV